LNVKLEDVYKGKTSKLKITRDVICKSCSGVGGKEGFERTCSSCNGRGSKMMLRQLGPGMMQQLQVPCESCGGEGKSIDRKLMCKDCSGRKVAKESKVVEVHIDKGVKNGHKVTFSGMSDERPGYETGDLVFVIQVQEHPVFKRRGADLLIEQEITLSEALCGFTIPVKHLDERTVVIKNDPLEVIKPGDIKCIEGEGMPVHQNPFNKGRLFVHFKVVFPEKGQIAPDAVAALDAILPSSKRRKYTAADEGVEFVSLTDVDVDSFGKYGAHGGGGEAYESDEDERGGHRGGVQCAQQ
jgi:DnaJ family protein A protein 2